MRDFRKAQKLHFDKHLGRELLIYKLDDLLKVPNFIPRSSDYWGEWVYNEQYFLLYYKATERGYNYEVDLERIHSYGDIVFWLRQLHEKNWTTSEDIGNLFSAFYDLFNCFRGTLPDDGNFDTTAYLKQRIRDRKVADAKEPPTL